MAYKIGNHLFFPLPNGSVQACTCIKEPYISQILKQQRKDFYSSTDEIFIMLYEELTKVGNIAGAALIEYFHMQYKEDFHEMEETIQDSSKRL